MPDFRLVLASWLARLTPARLRRVLYDQPWLARRIRSSLNRAAGEGLQEVTVAAGGLRGVRLLLDLQKEKSYWLGAYEPELQAAVAEWVQPGQVVYDVGANIGAISLLLAGAAAPGGRVYAFEALPANVERLRANLKLNPVGELVLVVPGAVVDAPGEAQFLVAPSTGMGKAMGSAGRDNVTYTETISVPAIALDQFVYAEGHPPPQVVKMDIEGGERLALPGMRRLLAEARPLLFLELHGVEAAQVVWEYLSKSGYRVCRMAPGYPQVSSPTELDWKAYLAAFPPEG